MSTEQSKALVKRIFTEVMTGRSFATIHELFAPEYVNHSMPMPTPGPEGFKAAYKMFTDAFPDMHIALDHIIAEDDMVATFGEWTGTNDGSFMGMSATGRKVKVQYMDVWRVENGKAIENWVTMDNMSIMQQLGLMPQPA